MTVEVYSLIDITKTNINKNHKPSSSSMSLDEWEFKRNQQRNWDTVIQLLGLRFQPFDISEPIKLENQRPAAWGFGWEYGPANNVSLWKFSFRYDSPVDLGSIRGDFDKVPIIINLEENIIVPYSCFSSLKEPMNIVFKNI